jgi:two-component system phosphate regulon sensor histidine kinase PhoR
MKRESGKIRLGIRWKWWFSTLSLALLTLVLLETLTLRLVDRQNVGEIERVLLITLLAVLVLFLPIGFFLSKRLTDPLHQMMEAARQIGQGNFSTRIRVRSGDELEELAEILNQMATELSVRMREISEDRAQLGAILNGMAEGVMVLDRKGRVTLINPALERMFGPARPLAKGIYHYELIRHRELNEFIGGVLTEPKQLSREIAFPGLRERTFLVQASVPSPSERSDAPFAVLVFHDITELRRLERVRKDFVANVSHELRTPLTSIKGYLEALSDLGPDSTGQAKEFLQTLQRHSQQMENIISDLLQLARIESGKEQLNLQEISAKPFLERIVQSILPLSQKKRQSMTIDASGEVLLHADPEKLARVVTNLLDNAIKYTPESGRIVIEAKEEAGDVALVVRDNGIGIPSSDLDRIFERFFRVDRARSRELGGTGLGLSIVKHLVEAHGGTISVESRLGEGSVFTARFPKSTSSVAA